MKRLWIFIILSYLILSAFQGISYSRYYRNEKDFKRGIQIEASERSGSAHIQVLYDKYDRMLSKAKIDANGNLIHEEVYDYDISGNLIRRSIRNGDGNPEKMTVYGDDEEMSRIFLAYVYPDRDPREFRDRVTIYEYLPGGEIGRYLFLSVDHTELGIISFQYFDSGLVKEERWIKQPGATTVRLYEYHYQPELQLYELTEYDSTGTRISHVGLVLPSEYLSTGSTNILEEGREIIQDIRQRQTGGWNPADELGPLVSEHIQKLPDLIYLKNGDTLEVDLLQITERFVRFKLRGESDVLTMPLSDVGEIERRDGEIVYPVLY